jgi:hypothetical protein
MLMSLSMPRLDVVSDQWLICRMPSVANRAIVYATASMAPDLNESNETISRSRLEMKNLQTHAVTMVIVCVLACLASSGVRSQALAEAERAKPVAGDPGISSMVVTDQPQFRVLRDYAEPDATRR